MASLSKEAELIKIADRLRNEGLFESVNYGQIAEKIGTTQKNLKKAIDEMRQNRIARFTISLNYQKLPVISARVTIKSKKPEHNEKIFDLIKSTPYLDSATYVASYKFSHVLSLIVPSLDKLKEVLNYDANVLSGLIENTNTMIVKNYFLVEGYRYKTKENEKVEIDNKDWGILNALRKDSARSLDEISGKVGLQTPTVYRRIKMLKKKGVINGYYCSRFIDRKASELTKTGYFVSIDANGSEEDVRELAQKIIDDKNGFKTNLVSLFGSLDLSFNFWVDSPMSVRKFANAVFKIKNVLGVRNAIILDHYKGDYLEDFV